METTAIMLLNEAKSAIKKYKCPYCDYRNNKEHLVSHVEDDHKDMIPKNYTPARIVFNSVNKKDHGTCVICGKTTQWNEEVWRYNRFCSDTCKKKAGELAAHNLMKAKGITRNEMLSDPEFQDRMLKNRKISGSYKFSTGGTVDYVGTYEYKFLKFMDEIMHYHSIDITSPGPTIPYMYNGEEHFWITDFMIIPFNLVIDVKDGGSNPNNREMTEYREKQKAKEDAIAKLGTYNYLRLTDNDFSQLLLMLAELKMNMSFNPVQDGPIIRINENVLCNPSIENATYKSIDELCSAVAGCMVGTTNNSSAYIVPYMKKNSFIEDYAITDDPSLEHILTLDDKNRLIPKSRKFLEEECEYYNLLKYNKTPFNNKINEVKNLVEAVTGKRLLHPEQVYYDSDFTKMTTPKEMETMQENCFMATLIGDNSYKIPVMRICFEENVMFYQDKDGYFVENTTNGFRSKSFENIDDIPNELVYYIERGEL